MLKTKFLGIELKSPLVLASGILGTSVQLMNRVIENGAGAVTTKSIGPVPRDGHDNPCVVEIDDGIYNAVGLPTPGFKNMDYLEWKNIKAPLIASTYGSSIDDYVKIVKHIQNYDPSIIELNISCPNKDDGMVFGKDENLTKKLVKDVKKASDIPIMPKLTPNCDNIGNIAKACEESGADAICAINTIQKKIIHPELKKPLVSYGKGGISGPIIKKIALSKIQEIKNNVDIPILGVGGITYGKDAVDMLKAGASVIGVGSAVYFRGIGCFDAINNEMVDIMKKKRYDSIDEVKDA